MRVTRQTICGLTLVASLGASAWLATPAGSAVSARPHGLTLLINGKKLPITPFSGPDRYNPIKATTLRVKALWKGSLASTSLTSCLPEPPQPAMTATTATAAARAVSPFIPSSSVLVPSGGVAARS
jgi:hypothetical protein